MPLDRHTTYGDHSACACPWCGEKMTDLWEIAPKFDGESEEIDCGWCGKPVVIWADYVYNIECERGDYEEEDD